MVASIASMDGISPPGEDVLVDPGVGPAADPHPVMWRTVWHDAAAPAVDVRAGGTPVFTNLTNPGEANADIPAGTVNADVTLAGTAAVAVGPADLALKEGTSTIVYAWDRLRTRT
jgi:hypothetical protein